MNRPQLLQVILSASLLLPVSSRLPAQEPSPGAAPMFPESARWQALLDQSLQATVSRFAEARLTRDALAVTLLVLDHDGVPVARAHHRGDVQIYPASVIKLFYRAAFTEGHAYESEIIPFLAGRVVAGLTE